MKCATYFIYSFIYFFVRYPDFFGPVGIWLDKKAGVDFKRYDVTTWETVNSNIYIEQHFKK